MILIKGLPEKGSNFIKQIINSLEQIKILQTEGLSARRTKHRQLPASVSGIAGFNKKHAKIILLRQ